MTNSPSLSTAVCLMHLFCGYLTILSSLPGNIEGFDARHASSLSYYRSRLPAAARATTTTTTTTTTNNNNNHRSSLKYAITTMAATNTQQNKIANKANNNRRNFIGTTASSVAAMMTAIFPQQQQQQAARAADVDVDADTVTVTGTESNNNDGSISSLSTSSTGTSSGSDVDTGRDGIISSKYCAYGMGDGCADLAEGNDFIKKLQAKSATNKESAQMEAKNAYYMKNYPDWFATVGKTMIKNPSDGTFILVDDAELKTLKDANRLSVEYATAMGGKTRDITQKSILVLKE